ncbi:26S proteasome regulatory subunit 6A [Tanacetum coccineum]
MEDDELASMTIEDIQRQSRLLDNEIRVFKEELQRTNLELDSFKDKIKENQEKIKLNKQLPYLVGNIVEKARSGRVGLGGTIGAGVGSYAPFEKSMVDIDASKEKIASTTSSSHSFVDPEKFIEEILEKASAIVLSEIKEENFKQHGDQLGTVVSNSMKTNLSLELKRLAVSFCSILVLHFDRTELAGSPRNALRRSS